MLKARVIPSLMLKGNRLIKTIKYDNDLYIGDPLNAIRIFNEKEVDELIILDIQASTEGKGPPIKIIREIAGECFMPLCYGGGIRSIEDINEILGAGVEKVAINSYAIENPQFIRKAAEAFGSQSIVISLDVKMNKKGKYEVFTRRGRKPTGLIAAEFARLAQEMGAGEIVLNAIDRDGTLQGYDIDLIKSVSSVVSIPVIASGGAGELSHLAEAINRGGASAVAVGSMFVLHGKHRAVLISYPSPGELGDMSL